MIGIIEILIGSLALLGNFLLALLNLNDKSPNVLAFVLITASVSILIGLGLLKGNKSAYVLLLYFSSVIILTKILIFGGIIQLNGELEVSVHRVLNIPLPEMLRQTMNTIKNIISIGYHAFIIHYLLKPEVRTVFHK